MLVIAAQFLAIGGNATLALVFWWGGAVLIFVFSFAVLFHMFRGEHVGLEHVTPAKVHPGRRPRRDSGGRRPLLELQEGARASWRCSRICSVSAPAS